MTVVPAAEYRPDIADINVTFTDQLLNVLPSANGYIPMKNWAPLTADFPENPLGAFAVRALDQSVHVFGGTTTGLYLLNNTDLTWQEVSKSAGAYHASHDAPWSFALFGNYVIAVNQNDSPQVYQIGVDSAFRDLGGSPPRAGLVKVWGDFVCLMMLPDNPNRVHWSGLNDAEFWTPGTNNCDYQDFPDGGRVQGSTEATNPLIFMQSAIYAGTFVPGSDIIFTFHKVQDKRGAKSPWGIACRGSYAFFADEGGFFQISSDGSQVLPIGYEKVDRTVFTRMAASNLSEMSAAIDPFYTRVYWAMDYNGTGIYNEMLVYDWGVQQWSIVQISATDIVSFYTAGYTLEGLDEVSTNLDTLPFSLDSKAWQGGAPILGAFRNNRLGSFTAENMEASVASPELAATDGSIQRTRRVYPIVDTDQLFVSVGVRFRRNQYEPVKWLPETSPSYNTGIAHKRSRARFHRFLVRIPAGEEWQHINGFDVAFEAAGWR
ncbi:hypothetical protein CN878_16710 [Ochrobactrum sp. 695/2009]|nr:hypothetical protein CN881_19575 [Ochrobactrum sp. 721/2009]PJT16738.1 hypothetical protein CN880_10440 [Ochrobactrum sp. 720/2009]PJT26560.1 hypothetical protein CN879_06405 [Ochrobactrum sp. 715/2009]PJT28624.1 hypothetical protein CN878_16710 [Ochrobactrum sp. 695/2009]PJT36080.1 hypothetical protein CN877_08850 [Ochrobactrum sp. 689/2009]